MSRLAWILIALLVVGVIAGCGPTESQSAPPATASGDAAGAAGGSSGTQLPSLPAVLPPQTADLVPVVKELVRLNSDNVVIAQVEDIKTAQDAQGSWWVSARAIPADSPGETLVVYLVSEGDQWVLRDFGADIDSGMLPAEVRDKL